MKTKTLAIITIVIAMAFIFTVFMVIYKSSFNTHVFYFNSIKNMATAHIFPDSSKRVDFIDTFDETSVVEENWPMWRSGNAHWWVSSGAYLFTENGVGKTISGNLISTDPWVKKFNKANAIDTANGYRPQNIFRMVLKEKASEFNQSLYGKVTHYDVSDSENRNASNGVLLFNRYQDQNTLYYTGIRVDGQVVIKKKLRGTYSTLAIAPLFFGTYDRNENPNLIPLNTWIGIKSNVITNKKGEVVIKFYIDFGETGNWKLVLVGVDDGKTYGEVISDSGYGGIRTDFMDAEFNDFVFESM